MKTKSFVSIFSLITVLLVLLRGELKAAPLQSATLIEKANEVTLDKNGQKRDAVVNDVIQNKDVLSTGKKSRAELEFRDKSIARLGSNTAFSFDPSSRKMMVQQGIALIHVPPGLSGASISTPAATAAISGDVIATHVDEKGVTQFVALSKDSEGPITITFNKTGENISLRPGELITLDPLASRISRPVTINVKAFLASSSLTKSSGGFKTRLPVSAQAEIKKAGLIQQKEIKYGILAVSNQIKLPAQISSSAELGRRNDIHVQTTGKGRFAGFYTGFGTFEPGGGRKTFQVFIRRDGRFFLFGFNANGSPFSASGFMHHNGAIVFDALGGQDGVLKLSRGVIGGVIHKSGNPPGTVTLVDLSRH